MWNRSGPYKNWTSRDYCLYTSWWLSWCSAYILQLLVQVKWLPSFTNVWTMLLYQKANQEEAYFSQPVLSAQIRHDSFVSAVTLVSANLGDVCHQFHKNQSSKVWIKVIDLAFVGFFQLFVCPDQWVANHPGITCRKEELDHVHDNGLEGMFRLYKQASKLGFQDIPMPACKHNAMYIWWLLCIHDDCLVHPYLL